MMRALALAFGLAWVASLAAPAPVHARGEVRFASPEAAYEQGIGAYKSGNFEIAIPALEHAAAHGNFFAQYYLARIYSDNQSSFTDHPKAYILFQRLADDNADIDPDDDIRAPLVARSFVELARYVRAGVPDLNVKPSAATAVEYLNHAATFFNDEDAQFELAKHFLDGDGIEQDFTRGKHFLSVLTRKGHPPAQAFLADLYWRGKFGLPQDPARALALITLAVKHARSEDRIWIGDIYQSIFCGANEGVRKQADGLVGNWSRQFVPTPPAAPGPHASLEPLGATTRTCSNGEPAMPPSVRGEAPPTPREMLNAPPMMFRGIDERRR